MRRDVVGVLLAQQAVIGKCSAKLCAQERLGVSIQNRYRVVFLGALELERQRPLKSQQRTFACRPRQLDGLPLEVLQAHPEKTPMPR
jgi:hypothetical protein